MSASAGSPEASRIAGGMPRMVLNFARCIALLVLPWLTLGVSQAEETFLPPKEAYKYTVEAAQGNVRGPDRHPARLLPLP